jgi:hypothetical protein
MNIQKFEWAKPPRHSPTGTEQVALPSNYVCNSQTFPHFQINNIIEFVLYFHSHVSIYYFAWQTLPLALSITVTSLAITWLVQFLKNGAQWRIFLKCMICPILIIEWLDILYDLDIWVLFYILYTTLHSFF